MQKTQIATQYVRDNFRLRARIEPPYTGAMTRQYADQVVHELARAGLADKLADMLAADRSLIDAKGMDARTPCIAREQSWWRSCS